MDEETAAKAPTRRAHRSGVVARGRVRDTGGGPPGDEGGREEEGGGSTERRRDKRDGEGTGAWEEGEHT